MKSYYSYEFMFGLLASNIFRHFDGNMESTINLSHTAASNSTHCLFSPNEKLNVDISASTMSPKQLLICIFPLQGLFGNTDFFYNSQLAPVSFKDLIFLPSTTKSIYSNSFLDVLSDLILIPDTTFLWWSFGFSPLSTRLGHSRL